MTGDDRLAPLVSVIIPVYNAAAYVRETVDSALHQAYPNLEVIVVDDGSTEDLSWVAAAYGTRVRYVRKPNGGPASARNLGIRMASGAYLAFLDADDLWEPDKLRAQMDLLLRHPSVGLVYSAMSEIDEQGLLRQPSRGRHARPSGDIAEALFWHNWVPTSTVVIRKACLEQVGGFDEARELISVEDYDMWLRIAERHEALYVDQPLARYRLHAVGISRSTDRSYSGEALVIERAVVRRGAGNPSVRRMYRRRLARLFFNWGHEHFTANRLREARAKFLVSLRHAPWNPRIWGFMAATFLSPACLGWVRRCRRRCAEPLQVAHGENAL